MTREDLLKMIPDGWEECTVKEYASGPISEVLQLIGREPVYARKKPKERKSVTFETKVSGPLLGGRVVWLGRQGPSEGTPLKVTLEWEE